MFYGVTFRLFKLSPGLQNLFPFAGEEIDDDHVGMKSHSLTVMTSIDACIKILDDVPQLQEELISLGAVHHIHGVTSQHFAVSVTLHLVKYLITFTL